MKVIAHCLLALYKVGQKRIVQDLYLTALFVVIVLLIQHWGATV